MLEKELVTREQVLGPDHKGSTRCCGPLRTNSSVKLASAMEELDKG